MEIPILIQPRSKNFPFKRRSNICVNLSTNSSILDLEIKIDESTYPNVFVSKLRIMSGWCKVKLTLCIKEFTWILQSSSSSQHDLIPKVTNPLPIKLTVQHNWLTQYFEDVFCNLEHVFNYMKVSKNVIIAWRHWEWYQFCNLVCNMYI